MSKPYAMSAATRARAIELQQTAAYMYRWAHIHNHAPKTWDEEAEAAERIAHYMQQARNAHSLALCILCDE